MERIGSIECGNKWDPRTWKGMGILNVERIGNLARGKDWELERRKDWEPRT